MKLLATKVGDLLISADRRRAAEAVGYGFALYEVDGLNDPLHADATFRHCGLVNEDAQIRAWLRGDVVTGRVVQIYPAS